PASSRSRDPQRQSEISKSPSRVPSGRPPHAILWLHPRHRAYSGGKSLPGKRRKDERHIASSCPHYSPISIVTRKVVPTVWIGLIWVRFPTIADAKIVSIARPIRASFV